MSVLINEKKFNYEVVGTMKKNSYNKQNSGILAKEIFQMFTRLYAWKKSR